MPIVLSQVATEVYKTSHNPAGSRPQHSQSHTVTHAARERERERDDITWDVVVEMVPPRHRHHEY